MAERIKRHPAYRSPAQRKGGTNSEPPVRRRGKN